MKLFSLLETQYVSMTEKIRKYLSQMLPSNTSYGSNTVFGQLINVLSASVQNIMLYIEDSLVEQNKYTAQRKKSIYGLAAISGYQPHLGKAAGVQLVLNYTPTNVQNLNVFLNNHESLTCTQNGLNYNIILSQEAILLSPEKDNSAKYLYAVQGRFENQTFISNGGKLYTQNFTFLGNLDVDYLTVRINNEIWGKEESLYDMIADGKQWTYKISPNGGVDLIFGNDCHGRSLKDGDVIKIEYLIHDGELGNLDVNTNTYFIFDNQLKDIVGDEVDGNELFNITFACSDAVTSGSNSESLEQVRHMIGLNSRSLVLASPEHYRSFINKFSFCGYNRTWSEVGSMVIKSLIIKNYKLAIKDGKDYFELKESDFKLTDQQKESLKNCIENTGNLLSGATYSIVDPELCKYALYLYIKPKTINYDKDQIELKIRNLVGEFFSNIQSDMYIAKSDITYLLKENISEIDGINAYFLSERNETALQTRNYKNITYKYNPSLGTYDKKIENVYLYEGENPNLGLDSHGNIELQADEQFPVLMGGWDFLNVDGDQVVITNPLIIIFE